MERKFPHVQRIIFLVLCEELRPYIERQRSSFREPVSVETQVAVTLYYLADEGRIRKISNAFGLGKSTVSTIIRRVTGAISRNLASKYIKLPCTENEVKESTEIFYSKHGFPQCIGAIDGTHIPIKKTVENPTDYINRKGRYTLNWQTVADHQYCFVAC